LPQRVSNRVRVSVGVNEVENDAEQFKPPNPNNISPFILFCLMVFNATFNNISVISWRSILLVADTGENHNISGDRH
jgi:hypothetical protein